jgi:acyl-CoA thioester hydrolase
MISCQLNFVVKSYDVDFAGVVSNIVYLRWLEDLRLELFEHTIPIKEFADQGLNPTLVRTEIDYRAPLHLSDQVSGVMSIVRVGNASFTFRAELRRTDGTLVASAIQVGCLVSARTGRPVSLPQTFREMVGATEPPIEEVH